MMTLYTVAFYLARGSVLLVEKTRPAWQAGLWNGIGGKLDTESESPIECCRREFREETCLDVRDWRWFCTEEGSDYYLCCFAAEAPQPVPVPQQNDRGERLAWLPYSQLGDEHHPVVGNLRWLIPLAQDWRQPEVVNVRTRFRNITERPSW